MKNTGIKRKLDKLGRITIPIELRKSLGLDGKLEIYVQEGAIVIRKVSSENKEKSL